MGQNNNQATMRREDLTGKTEQSEAAQQAVSKQREQGREERHNKGNIEQTERESHNKGIDEATPDLKKERPELKEAPESLKNSK